MNQNKEFAKIKNQLNTDRDNGNINFISMKKETKNGNTYISVKCSNKENANTIQKKYQEKLNVYSSVSFDGIKNPATDYRYVYFVIHNYTFQ